MRRLLSLWLPDFAIELSQREAPVGGPLALLTGEKGRLLLAAVDPAAAAAGLAPGQSLAAARTLVPDLVVRPERPAETAAALERLGRWCGRYTPWVAADPASGSHAAGVGGDGGLFLDITGCAHLVGGEAALAGDLLRRLARAGHHARLAVAPTPGAAWALARHATDADCPAFLLPPPPEGAADEDGQSGGENHEAIAAALAPLPVAALRLPAEARESMARLGLERIGQLYGLPPAGLASRFGPLPARRLRQALGRQAEPIDPARPAAPPWVLRRFAEPIVAPTDIERALLLLLEELTGLLERRGEGARRLEFVGHRVDGGESAVVVGLGRPSRDRGHLLRLFAPKLERLEPGYGFESLALVARRSEAMAPEQAGLRLAAGREPADSLFALAGPSAIPDGIPAGVGKPTPFAELIDRLENRLGEGTVRRLEPAESHWPETAVRAVAPHAVSSPSARGAGVQARQAAATQMPAMQMPGAPGTPRPLFLLRRAEPLEIAGPLNEEGCPESLVWRRRRLSLVAGEGPERLLPPWWQPRRAGEAPRDYWRVEDAEGRRWWIYRALESDSPAASAAPRPAQWFLHGLFA